MNGFWGACHGKFYVPMDMPKEKISSISGDGDMASMKTMSSDKMESGQASLKTKKWQPCLRYPAIFLWILNDKFFAPGKRGL